MYHIMPTGFHGGYFGRSLSRFVLSDMRTPSYYILQHESCSACCPGIIYNAVLSLPKHHICANTQNRYVERKPPRCVLCVLLMLTLFLFTTGCLCASVTHALLGGVVIKGQYKAQQQYGSTNTSRRYRTFIDTLLGTGRRHSRTGHLLNINNLTVETFPSTPPSIQTWIFAQCLIEFGDISLVSNSPPSLYSPTPPLPPSPFIPLRDNPIHGMLGLPL